MEDRPDCDKLQKLQKLKYILHEIEQKLVSLTKTFGWIHGKLVEGDDSDIVTCSICGQQRIPKSNKKLHEENCCLHSPGYRDSDKLFSEYSGSGSCISLTSQLLHSITKNISAVENIAVRSIPQTSAEFDQNFNREEKLAIYDYVIANTEKKKSFSDLYKQVSEKKEEKRELTVWGLAAAERNAKRRRASYRNKVPTNCKTHTQILRETIEVQMEILKEEGLSKSSNEESKNLKSDCIKPNSDQCLEEKKKFHKSSHCQIREDDSKRKHWDKHNLWNTYSCKRSRTDYRGDSGSRSGSCDKYKKWKSSNRRTHFHKSTFNDTEFVYKLHTNSPATKPVKISYV